MAERILLLDVGLGNLRSVQKALEAAANAARRSIMVVRSDQPEAVRGADRLVVPGQGGFRDFARAISGPVADALTEATRAGKPYFGICLGLQLLFEASEEAPGEVGLGWFAGTVRRLTGQGVKIPHLGWNQLELTEPVHPYLQAARGAAGFCYFVHSFHGVPDDVSLAVAHVRHGQNHITAAVARDNVFATQFHPEKSQATGLAVLRAFLEDRA